MMQKDKSEYISKIELRHNTFETEFRLDNVSFKNEVSLNNNVFESDFFFSSNEIKHNFILQNNTFKGLFDCSSNAFKLNQIDFFGDGTNYYESEFYLNNNTFENPFIFSSNEIENKFFLQNNIFKGLFNCEYNPFKNELSLSSNTFEKQSYFNYNTFKDYILLDSNTFKEPLDFSSSSFAGALYLANSIFKEGIITYNINLISNIDDNKKISSVEYITNCINKIENKSQEIEKRVEEDLNNFRLSAGIIKTNLLNSHNKIDASIWHSVELYIQTKILSLSKFKSLKDFGEYIVFSISGLVSNHHQNIIRPFICLFIIFIILNVFCTSDFINYYYHNPLFPLYTDFKPSKALDMMIPFSQFSNEITTREITTIENSTFWAKLSKIFITSIVGYIVWHIIQTSRHKTK